MSVGDVLAVVTILIDLGKDLYDRFEAMKQVENDLLLLNMHLKGLSNVFEGSKSGRHLDWFVRVYKNARCLEKYLRVLQQVCKSP